MLQAKGLREITNSPRRTAVVLYQQPSSKRFCVFADGFQSCWTDLSAHEWKDGGTARSYVVALDVNSSTCCACRLGLTFPVYSHQYMNCLSIVQVSQ